MTRTLIHTKITTVVAVAGLALAACACDHGPPPTPVDQQTTVSPAPQQTTSSPAPQPLGMPVCGDLTEIGDDLTTLQYGPASNAPQELQALGVQLSKVVAETSQQSSDLGVLIQDFNADVTDTSGGTTLGTSLDQGPAAYDSSMDDDLNALMSDCGS